MRAFLVSLTLALAPLAAHAMEVQQAGDVSYVSGGVGEEERSDLVLSLPDFNLKVTTAAQGSGAFLAGVALDVRDAGGALVFATVLDGPFLLARLPVGRYELRATFQDRTETRSIQIRAHGARELFFYWTDPSATVLKAGAIAGSP